MSQTSLTAPPTRGGRRSAGVILVAVAVAAAVNVVLFLVGRGLGATYTFTAPAGPAQVNAVTVAGFSIIPLLVGLVLAALLGRRWPALYRVAMVVAPVLALVTILVMTLPADLDPLGTVVLALCHVTLAPVSVLALLRLSRLSPRRG